MAMGVGGMWSGFMADGWVKICVAIQTYLLVSVRNWRLFKLKKFISLIMNSTTAEIFIEKEMQL